MRIPEDVGIRIIAEIRDQHDTYFLKQHRKNRQKAVQEMTDFVKSQGPLFEQSLEKLNLSLPVILGHQSQRYSKKLKWNDITG